MAAESFFTTSDSEWFVPTGRCRGPWNVDYCHAGPPAGLLARSSERTIPEMRLARLTVELAKPIPMAGFRIQCEVIRRSRNVGITEILLSDHEGGVRAMARGLHLASRTPAEWPTARISTPHLGRAMAGEFPIGAFAHDEESIVAGTEVRYPPGQNGQPGPTTLWMRTVPLLPGEAPSGFQAICPLADSGNATSRNAEPWEVAFINADLTISLHRQPVGEWFGSSAISHWQADGSGMSDALLFDEVGPVGRAIQMLLLTKAPYSS